MRLREALGFFDGKTVVICRGDFLCIERGVGDGLNDVVLQAVVAVYPVVGLEFVACSCRPRGDYENG